MYFIENAIKNEIALGAKQCLALYTSFFHNKIENENVAVYNVPLPAENLTEFIKKLPESLKISGFDSNKKTFVLLDNVASSISKADFTLILGFLNEILPQGSAICFDYPYGVLNDETRYNYIELEALLESCSFLIYKTETTADFIDYCLAIKH